MKAFLTRLFIFATLLFGMAWLADEVVSALLKKSRQLDYGVWNDLMTGKVNSDIVIHGSSRAWVQLDPTAFEKVFGKRTYNLGIDAFGFHMQYCRHLLLLTNNKTPATIIHVLDYSIFDKSEFLFYPEQFFPYLGDSIIDVYTSSYKGIDQFERHVPYLRYAGNIRPLQHAAKILLRPDLNVPDRQNGFQAQHLPWNNDLYEARLKLKDSYREHVDSTIVRLFREYILDCKKKEIQLIFVYPPEWIGGQDFVQNRKEILNLFQTIAAEYDIPYFDYSDHKISHDQKYFYNTEHLNAAGSELFTSVFVNDLKAIL